MLGVNSGAAATVLKTIIEAWTRAAELMVSAVARRLARGITEDGWAEQKARETLALRAELERIAAGLDQATPDMVLDALEKAYRMGTTVAEQLGQLNITSRPEAVVRFAAYLAGQLQGSLTPVVRAHEDLYRRVVGDVELLMQTGTIVRREAIAQSVDRLLTAGEDRFTDSAGRRWHLDAYVRMAGRTMAQQAAVEGQLDGMRETGRDLVVISDSVRECPLCRPWEGKLLSVTGGTPEGTRVDGHVVRGTVAEARAAGLWHPNCTHRADPFIPGLSRVAPAKAAPQGYRDQQTLRRLERDLRDLKRRSAAAEQLGDTQTARELRAKTRAKSAQIREHVEATGQLRKRDREKPYSG